MDRYIACFDISEDKPRAVVAKTLLNYGKRVQHSVFEVAFSGANSQGKLKSLIEELEPWLEDTDDLRFYRLCENCCQKSLNVNNEQIAQFSDILIT